MPDFRLKISPGVILTIKVTLSPDNPPIPAVLYTEPGAVEPKVIELKDLEGEIGNPQPGGSISLRIIGTGPGFAKVRFFQNGHELTPSPAPPAPPVVLTVSAEGDQDLKTVALD